METRTDEAPNRTLWVLVLSPAVWAAHFMISYVTAATWCARLGGPEASLSPVRFAIVGYTVVALAVIGAAGIFGHRDHTRGEAALPHDDDTPMDRTRFLGFCTLLLSGLSAVAVVYAALTVIFFESCQ